MNSDIVIRIYPFGTIDKDIFIQFKSDIEESKFFIAGLS